MEKEGQAAVLRCLSAFVLCVAKHDAAAAHYCALVTCQVTDLSLVPFAATRARCFTSLLSIFQRSTVWRWCVLEKEGWKGV